MLEFELLYFKGKLYIYIYIYIYLYIYICIFWIYVSGYGLYTFKGIVPILCFGAYVLLRVQLDVFLTWVLDTVCLCIFSIYDILMVYGLLCRHLTHECILTTELYVWDDDVLIWVFILVMWLMDLYVLVSVIFGVWVYDWMLSCVWVECCWRHRMYLSPVLMIWVRCY